MNEFIDLGTALVALGIFFIIGLALFLIMRFLVLWYYKINKRVDLLAEQNRLLKEILNQLTNNNK